jgi:HSP20 family molecular chaperone IbpA
MTEQTKEFETTKEELTTPEGVESTRPGRTYVPRADIYEKENGILVLADLPGVDENNLDIVLEKGVLTIDGQATQPWPEGYNLVHYEYEVGNYHRAFKLSEEVDQDKIEATIKNGVLSLYMPFASGPRTRKIQVQPA